jgi:hypothetical protein
VQVVSLLVGLDVELLLDVCAVDVHLRADDRRKAAVGLLERHLARDVRHLGRGGGGEGEERNRGGQAADKWLEAHGQWSPAR